MVYFRELDSDSTPVPFDTGLLESKGRGLVSASDSLSNDAIYLRIPSAKPWYKAVVSIVICTHGRAESLNDTLESLTQQTFKDFEVIIISEKGNLSELRDKGLKSSKGYIVSLIDDDVYCPSSWLEGVLKGFRKGVVGVTGPTEITEEYRNNRDLFKFKKSKKIYDWIFIGKGSEIPSYLSKCGTPSTRSNDTDCDYEGQADFLEACNFSVIKEEAIKAGGFSNIYVRTGEWCEVDLSLALKQFGTLWFSPHAKLFHRPSKSGIYTNRLATSHRWENFMRFQRKWEGKYIDKTETTYLYRGFMWLYFRLKETLKF